MSICRGCQTETLRTIARYSADMQLLSEVCPSCDPEKFRGVKVTDPTDRRIWAGHEAEPEKYYDADDQGVKRAKDELRQDIWNEWNVDEDEQAREQKRRMRRTTPMTREEIAAAENYGSTVLRPAIEEGRKASAS
jgi:predicted  nucleic acid-binding Zn-ribbon protein